MSSLNHLNPLSKCRSFWCDVVSCAVTCFSCSAYFQDSKTVCINTYRCIKWKKPFERWHFHVARYSLNSSFFHPALTAIRRRKLHVWKSFDWVSSDAGQTIQILFLHEWTWEGGRGVEGVSPALCCQWSMSAYRFEIKFGKIPELYVSAHIHNGLKNCYATLKLYECL